MNVDRRRLRGEREQLLPGPRFRFIDRAAELELPLVLDRPARSRSDRQHGELVDDVLARWDAGGVGEQAMASEAA